MQVCSALLLGNTVAFQTFETSVQLHWYQVGCWQRFFRETVWKKYSLRTGGSKTGKLMAEVRNVFLSLAYTLVFLGLRAPAPTYGTMQPEALPLKTHDRVGALKILGP